jgi:hypothetical protein
MACRKRLMLQPVTGPERFFILGILANGGFVIIANFLADTLCEREGVFIAPSSTVLLARLCADRQSLYPRVDLMHDQAVPDSEQL